jgi:3-deoxy-D-manno-octulosonate 8-phosphate phosphatase (KDO 8-P phosphatase)
MEQLLDKFSKIKTFVFDVDGVLTNGNLLVQSDGTLLRTMNIKDGYALQLAVKKGYNVWVISGAKDSGAVLRLHNLGVQHAYFAIKDKREKLNELLQEYNIGNRETVLYMGDDMPDIVCMNDGIFATAPRDACQDVLEKVQYISHHIGGRGCVRDVIEKVLKINGHWE